jgi:hypothetical protein
MKWIVLAIVVFVAGYTYVNLRFRKVASFQPYEDARERAHLARAGYRRVSLGLSQPANGWLVATPAASAPGGLPADLAAGFIATPALPESIDAVAAAGSLDGAQSYPIRFDCVLPDTHGQLDSAHLYQKGADLFIVVGFARLTGDLAVRETRTQVLVTIPAGALENGRYRVILAGRTADRSWTLQVH